jgi:thymidylate kinase
MPEQISLGRGQVDVTDRDKTPTKDSAQGHSLSHFLRLFFRLLDEHEIRYCVLHSSQGLPDELPSDLDLAVHPRDRASLPLVFQGLAVAGYRPAQCLNYFSKADYFVFLWFEGVELRSLALDIIFEHRRSGLISLRDEELVASRIRHGDFWVAAPQVEFTYLLAKRTWKGTASPRQALRLKRLAELLGPEQATKLAGKIFLGGLKRRVVDACLDGSIDELLARISAQPWRTAFLRHPWGLTRFLLGEGLRFVRRWFQPTGLFIVVLGPDGVGKSTMVGRLIEALSPCFRRERIFHYRPMVIAPQKETGGPVTDPHDTPVRGTLGSIAALFVTFLDYLLGFAFVLRPFLARSGLIIFDRYYHDLLIDPIRYRYGGPLWLARFVGRFVPPPDLLFLVLDAEDEVIFSRKREVPPEELRRQREGYQQFTLDTNRAALIKADRGIEQTTAEASRFVVEFLTQRFQRRNERWLACKPTSEEGNQAAWGGER